ncbi:MAG: hypothetical protein A3F09_03455 [Chlamydiae bacterium RIFCSPHIGHO2_12_FULL_49_11]|nr:MAG: hypothetical protein A3F09_03455 [Chlamydiae bacterium RIFCSPHIGHO2_12_FULL_49_11]
MKKQSIILTLLVAAFGFADQPFDSQEIAQMSPSSDGAPAYEAPVRKGSIYFRAITDSQPSNVANVFPGLGIGYRRSFNHSGVDISFNYSNGKGWGAQNARQILWTAPKVSYLYYFSPQGSQSVYGGLGLGWGGTQLRNTAKNERSNFLGLIPNFSLGYELLRHSIISSFMEVTISQPLIPSSSSGTSPGPVVEFSLGAGF